MNDFAGVRYVTHTVPVLPWIAPGDTNWTFVADYYPDEIIGTTSLTYCFHPLSGVESGVCHTVSFTLEEAAIENGCTYFTAVNRSRPSMMALVNSPDVSIPEALNFSPHFNVDGGGCILATPIVHPTLPVMGWYRWVTLELLSSFGEGCGELTPNQNGFMAYLFSTKSLE